MTGKLTCFISFWLLLSFSLLAKTAYQGIPERLELPISFRIVNYDLDFIPDFTTGSIKVHGILTIQKIDDSLNDTLSLLLYRLLEIDSASNQQGDRLPVKQCVTSFNDWQKLQANWVQISLNKQLRTGEYTQVSISYSGYLEGYTETGMLYVQDKIKPSFTILRPDAYAYPVVGIPSYAKNRQLGLPEFNYLIRVTVPDTLDVITAGKLVSRQDKESRTTYVFENKIPAWRMDIVIGRYNVIGDRIKVYHLEEDSLGAVSVLNFSRKALVLYTDWWGDIEKADGFTIIELPSGYGSQADYNAILQTADAFRDTLQMRQVYHEVSHLWNIDPIEPSNRCNEGLATFVEYLTMEVIHGDSILDHATAWYWNHIKMISKNDSIFSTTPFCDYGQKSLTSHSYSTGMILFFLIYEKVGQEKFNSMIKEIRLEYVGRKITDDEFMQNLVDVSGGVVKDIVDDWYFTPGYQRFVGLDYTLNELVEEY